METDAESIRKRYETLSRIFEEQFAVGLDEYYAKQIHLNKELLHCAINAYFDDIYKYKNYAGSEYADRHKQAAFTMLWISYFKPIQINRGVDTDTVLLTINERFAIFAGLSFLRHEVMESMTDKFFWHLIYILTYRQTDGRSLATMMYLMESCALKEGKF